MHFPIGIFWAIYNVARFHSKGFYCCGLMIALDSSGRKLHSNARVAGHFTIDTWPLEIRIELTQYYYHIHSTYRALAAVLKCNVVCSYGNTYTRAAGG